MKNNGSKVRASRSSMGGTFFWPSSPAEICEVLDLVDDNRIMVVISAELETEAIAERMIAANAQDAATMTLPRATLRKVVAATENVSVDPDMAIIEAGRLKGILRAV